jgi:hypothetical protein
MFGGSYDPSCVQATSGVSGEYDTHDQQVLEVYHKLLKYIIGTEEGSTLKRMMVELTNEIFE